MTNKEAIKWLKTFSGHYGMKELADAVDIAINVLEQNPRTGHWITKVKSDSRGDMWLTNPKCSKCGGEPYYNNTIYNYKFCPYCGAKMVESEG